MQKYVRIEMVGLRSTQARVSARDIVTDNSVIQAIVFFYEKKACIGW